MLHLVTVFHRATVNRFLDEELQEIWICEEEACGIGALKTHENFSNDLCTRNMWVYGLKYPQLESVPGSSKKRRGQVSVTSQRFVKMLKEFFLPELNKMSLDVVWFQQDGATAHTSKALMALVNEAFSGHVIFLRGDLQWSARAACSILRLAIISYRDIWSPSCTNTDPTTWTISRVTFVKPSPTFLLRCWKESTLISEND